MDLIHDTFVERKDCEWSSFFDRPNVWFKGCPQQDIVILNDCWCVPSSVCPFFSTSSLLRSSAVGHVAAPADTKEFSAVHLSLHLILKLCHRDTVLYRNYSLVWQAQLLVWPCSEVGHKQTASQGQEIPCHCYEITGVSRPWHNNGSNKSESQALCEMKSRGLTCVPMGGAQRLEANETATIGMTTKPNTLGTWDLSSTARHSSFF